MSSALSLLQGLRWHW